MQRIWVLILLSLLWGRVDAQSAPTWRVGWFHWAPYQEAQSAENDQPDGLDIEMVKRVAQKLSIEMVFEEMPWSAQIDRLKLGRQDVALGATKTREREGYASFSIPYRQERISLFVRAVDENVPDGDMDATALLNFLKKSTYRLGVVEGMVYGDARLEAFLHDPLNARRIVWAHTDQDHIWHLRDKTIDGILTDRLSGAMVLWGSAQGRFVSEVPLNVTIPIHMMFHKKSITPALLKKVNGVIEGLKAHGVEEKITNKYLFAIPLQKGLTRPWFMVLEFLGVFAFALSGVLIAFRLNLGLLSTGAIMALPTLGSLIIRDSLTLWSFSVYENPLYIYVLFIVFVVFTGVRQVSALKIYGHKLLKKPPMGYIFTIQVLDAVGLAAITVTTVLLGAVRGWNPLWLWGAGAAILASSGCLLLREHFWRTSYHIKSQFFIENAALWSVLFALLLRVHHEGIISQYFYNSVLLVFLGIVVTRIVAIYFGWKNVKLPGTLLQKKKAR